MVLEIADWRFMVDVQATRKRTAEYSFEHCQCGYCTNFYDTIDLAHPYLRPAMDKFGVHLEGPSELMPFEPTLMLACYRVDGRILQWGNQALRVGTIPVVPECADENSFFLWVGEIPLPWIQKQAPEDVVSPANLPEFMERMRLIWQLRHGTVSLSS